MGRLAVNPQHAEWFQWLLPDEPAAVTTELDRPGDCWVIRLWDMRDGALKQEWW